MSHHSTAHRFRVERTATGYSAHDEAAAVYTTGESLDALLANITEALALHYEDHRELPAYEVALEGLVAEPS